MYDTLLVLMELIDIKTTKEIVRRTSRVDKNFLIYGEPWKGGDSPIKNGTYKGSQKNENFSVFNDTFRDAIRGDNSPSKGFINGEQHNGIKAWNIIEGLKGSIYTITHNLYFHLNYELLYILNPLTPQLYSKLLFHCVVPHL